MNRKWKTLSIAIPAAGLLLSQCGCDDTSALLDPRFSLPQDPPAFYTIINSATFPSAGKLVRVQFNRYGIGFKIYVSGVTVAGPHQFFPKPSGIRAGGGTLDPDPDEHQMDPDLWPEPDDEFPRPDPPLPMPDYPDEDPFDGLPEPPPFPPDEMDITNLSDNTLGIFDSGGEQLGFGGIPKSEVRQASVVGKIPVGVQPAGIARTQDRSTAVVANLGDDTVTVIKNRAVAGTIKLPPLTRPYGIALSKDGTRAYVTSFVRTGGAVLVLDVVNRTVLATIATGNFPAAVAITPDGAQAWVTSVFEDSITIVDTLTNTFATRITGVSNGWGISFSPDGTRAYVADSALAGGGLFVLDASNYRIITRIALGNSPRTVAVTPTGRHVFVTNRGSDFISQIDARTNKLIRNIQVGRAMEGIQFVK